MVADTLCDAAFRLSSLARKMHNNVAVFKILFKISLGQVGCRAELSQPLYRMSYFYLTGSVEQVEVMV